MSDISDHFHDVDRALAGQLNVVEECVIANTVTALSETVYVRLPNGDAPRQRHAVTYWRLSVGLNGSGDLVPRWPTENEKAIVLTTDTDALWMIY